MMFSILRFDGLKMAAKTVRGGPKTLPRSVSLVYLSSRIVSYQCDGICADVKTKGVIKKYSKYANIAKLDIDVTRIKFIETTDKKGLVNVSNIIKIIKA